MRRSNPVVEDHYYRDMRSTRAAVSGDGFTIARNGLLPGLRADRQEAMLEGAIVPNGIRSRRDPLSSQPYDYQEGQIGYKYQLRPSQMKESNSVDLMRKARASYYSRINRFSQAALPVSEVNKPPPPLVGLAKP